MITRTRFAALSCILFALSACAQLGLAPAQSFNQKLAYAYGVHTSVLQATTAGVGSGSLSSEDATKVLAMADQSKVLLDSAASLSIAGNATGANNNLALAVSALSALQQFLNAHEQKK
jgi:hypothetical protein